MSDISPIVLLKAESLLNKYGSETNYKRGEDKVLLENLFEIEIDVHALEEYLI